MKTKFFPNWLRMMTVFIMLLAALAPVTTAHAATCTVGSDADSGWGTLRDALANSACDTINFAGDTTIYLASTLTIARNVTIDGAGHSVTISGDTGNDGTANVQVFRVNSGVTANLKNLIVAKGYTTDWYGGGAIFNQGTLTVSNSTFSDNSAGGSAGGIGGAISSYAINYTDIGQILTVSNSTFSGNSATYAGGAIYSYGKGATVNDSTFSGNASGQGGGGAIWFDSGTMNVQNSTFSGNSSNGGGGATYNYMSTVNVSNSTFSGNLANGRGGAIYGDSPQGRVNVTNSTFSGNSSGAAYGASIGNAYVLTIKNSILVKGASGPNCSGYAPSSDSTTNLADDDSCGTSFTNSASILLGTLGNYGGSADTLPLLAGSAAIDAGNDTVCAAAPVNNLDQRGVTRPQGAHCDIGAFEKMLGVITKTGGDNQSTSITTAFPTALQVRVSDAGGAGVPTTVTFAVPSSGASATFNGNSSATVATDSNGYASVVATANGVPGSYTVTATSPDAPAPVEFTLTNIVIKADTTTTLSSSANPSTYGDMVTFTAVVSVIPPGTVTPGGTVTFYEQIGTGGGATPSLKVQSKDARAAKITKTTKVSAAGAAEAVYEATYTFSTSALSVGVHNIVAVYSGDALTNGSTSNVVAQTVNPPAVTVMLSSALNPSTYGQSVTFTALVSGGSGSSTVSFQDNSSPITGCDAVNLASGQATCTVATLAAGSHAITAVYNSTTSNTVTQQVDPAPLTVTANDASKVYGAPLSAFSVSYSGFVNGETESVLGGTLAFDTTATQASNVGDYDVTPKGLTSTNYDITFIKGTLHITPAGTTTTLTGTPNPAAVGQIVHLTASVAANAPSTLTPSGTATFKDGSAAICSNVALDASGQATCDWTAALPGGTHTLQALFSGGANWQTSSGSVDVTVGQPDQAPVIMTQPADQAVYAGQTATFSAAASGSPAPTVLWQVSTDGGATWSDLAGATATTYSFTASLGQNGYKYHAVFMNTAGSATSNAATLTVKPAADLGVTKTTGALPSDAKITYIIVVTNNGPLAAQSVVLTDPLPSGTTFVSVKTTQGTCSAKNKTITCNIGNLDFGQSVTITLVVKRTNFSIDIVNTATVSSATYDPNAANNTASVTVPKK